MSSTPLLVVTEAGLAAASVATPTGPFIEIGSFAVGSAYGYEVTSSQKALNGNLLYQGPLTGYASVGDGVLALTCKIPPDAGPFDFGEVALYLTDGTLFAKAAFDKPQTKYSSLGTNLALTYTFVCLLKLEQSVATFKIVTNTDSSNTLLQLTSWSDVVPPGLAADPNVQMMLVKELDDHKQSTLLIQSSDTKWTPASTYYRLGEFELANAAATWVELLAAEWPYLTGVDLSGIELSSLLVETDDGFFRSVASVQHVGNPVTSVRFLLNPEPLLNIPVIGSKVIIHTNSISATSSSSSSTGGSSKPWEISITGNAATADLALEATHAESATTALTATNCPAYLPLAGGDLTGHKLGFPLGSTWNVSGSMLVAANVSLDSSMATWHAIAAGKGAIYVANAVDGSHQWYSVAQAVASAQIVPVAQMSLDASGNLTAVGNVAAYSDRTLKEDLQVIANALDKVAQLTGYTYHRIGSDSPRRDIGLIAQDVQAVQPEAVLESKGLLALNYGGLTGLLVEAIKELRSEIETIKAKL